MSIQRVVILAVLAPFTAFSLYAVYVHGYLGIFASALSSVATTLLLVDLTIALSLALLWMHSDMRGHLARFVPYALITFLFGSVGPLLYLLRRDARSRAEGGRARQAALAR
jgi:hypothetical protein